MRKIGLAKTDTPFSDRSLYSFVLVFDDDILEFIDVLELLVYGCFGERKHSAETLGDLGDGGDLFFAAVDVAVDHLYWNDLVFCILA